MTRIKRKHTLAFSVILLASLTMSGCGNTSHAKDQAATARPDVGKTLELFIGSASKPPTEQLINDFEKQTGAVLNVHFGGSGAMLSQMELSGRGDLYFPGSSDYMQKAIAQRVVRPKTEKIIVYLVPAINVPKANPKHIRSLADLARPGVRVAIARPDAVCVGLYAAELLDHAHLANAVRPNIVTYTESCSQTAAAASTGAVDAVIGWRVFQYWDPAHIKTILLRKSQIPRLGYIPIAVARTSKHPQLAEKFIAYLRSAHGRKVFEKWHYLVTKTQAERFAAPNTPVGGSWPLPSAWK